MKSAITAILAISLFAIPTSAMAHIETWAEYDQRLEKQIAEVQGELPIEEEIADSPLKLKMTSLEKRGKVIITTFETEGESGFIPMAESMGGVEKFKAMEQRRLVKDALMTSGLQLARRYTLRYRYIDGGKEVCTVDVSSLIIVVMIDKNFDFDQPEYTPQPLTREELNKLFEYKKYLKGGGYPPAMTEEERHRVLEFFKYNKY